MGKIRASLVQASPRYELGGIVDPSQERGESLASQYGVRIISSVFLIEGR